MGIWTSVEPRSRGRHSWVFAHYVETPSEREDGQWLDALYFRSADRTKFGKLEFLGELAKHDFRAIATKVDMNSEYRASLFSDDPELPKLWRKR
jgi:hypothetical protein